jgi:S-adenosylmethionine:tRNA ribosyltransferase-isomerase
MDNHPGQIRIEDYDYVLPDDRIASHPLAERDASRVLLFAAAGCSDRQFRQLADEIPAGSLLVFNDTRVIRARLLLAADAGQAVEIFCLEPVHPADYQLSLSNCEQVTWCCLVGGNRKWKSGTLELQVQSDSGAARLTITRLERLADGSFNVAFRWDNPALTFADVLEAAGQIPLPPYLNRPAEEEDEYRYQTIYAKEQGSVAAPTAGLHFTQGVMQSLQDKGIDTAYVTLHVGAGTFRPVKSELMAEHAMHRESVIVSRQLIERLLQQMERGLPIIVVGTTSLRTLESLYWFGVQCGAAGPKDPLSFELDQWEPYRQHPDGLPDGQQSLRQLLAFLGDSPRLEGDTQLLIAPGYHFRIADALITNFHQPRSTLLLLIAAFIGPAWREVYAYALANGFRFLSYGDSSLLWRSKGELSQ